MIVKVEKNNHGFEKNNHGFKKYNDTFLTLFINIL